MSHEMLSHRFTSYRRKIRKRSGKGSKAKRKNLRKRQEKRFGGNGTRKTGATLTRCLSVC